MQWRPLQASHFFECGACLAHAHFLVWRYIGGFESSDELHNVRMCALGKPNFAIIRTHRGVCQAITDWKSISTI